MSKTSRIPDKCCLLTKQVEFSTTADGASSPTERFRINNAGSFSAVIPSGSTLFPAFFCRAWVAFNGAVSPISVFGNGNVSSITDNGLGDYTVNFSTALPDSNYSCNVTAGDTPTYNRLAHVHRGSRSTSSIKVVVVNNAFALADCNDLNVSVFR